VNPSLEQRVRELRARVLVRSWEYRQRHLARGVWFRLRRTLADASAAFIVPASEAGTLLDEGYRAEPVGAELQPPRVIVFAPPERVAQIASARSIPVRLGPELLAAECLVLTPFD
jgi:hypothetical protein